MTEEHKPQPLDCEQKETNACATCTHQCPMAQAMTANPVPWWVWAICAAGALGVGFLLKLIFGG